MIVFFKLFFNNYQFIVTFILIVIIITIKHYDQKKKIY